MEGKYVCKQKTSGEICDFLYFDDFICFSILFDSTRYRSNFQMDLWGESRIQFGRYYISPFVSKHQLSW